MPAQIFRRQEGYLTAPERSTAELERQISATLGMNPVVLVAASFGAFTALLYASRHPDLVSGLVLVDPSHPKQAERAFAILENAGAGETKCAAAFLAYTPEHAPEWWRVGCDRIRSIRTLGSLRMIVLAAGCPEIEGDLSPVIYERLVGDRHEQMREYARLSSRGECRVVEQVGHGIVLAKPDVVLAAIDELWCSDPALRMREP
jgi:pimeloyl-ACP methyl ester carboxylesterase